MSQKKAVVVSASVYRGTGVLLRVDFLRFIRINGDTGFGPPWQL